MVRADSGPRAKGDSGVMLDVAIVYSGDMRDNGTPFYVRLAMAQHFGQEPEWYTEDPSAEKGGIAPGHDFYVHVDDGRDDFDCTNIPHPWGYWAVDSHLGPGIRIAKAKLADVVWCAQKPFVEVLAALGIKARWLPLACEPLLHCTAEELAAREDRQAIVPDKDLVFVGHLAKPTQSPADRVMFLDRLFKTFPNSWYAYGCFHEEMSRAYHRGRLGVNHAVRDDLNMRFFELASMGIPQLADARMVGLADLGFNEFEHFIPYASTEGAVERAGFALDPAQEANRLDMADLARTLVRAHHTYRTRLCTMLEDVEQFLQSSRGTPICASPSEASQP